MNTKLLAASSILIAFACHIILFNFSMIVFDIAPEEPRPVLYFFGPILAKSALQDQTGLSTLPREEGQSLGPIPQKSDLSYLLAESDGESNPFLVRSIKKPLQETIPDGNQKASLKSIFDTEMGSSEKSNGHPTQIEPPINIVPYKPLRLQMP